jgi:hypothetical protein
MFIILSMLRGFCKNFYEPGTIFSWYHLLRRTLVLQNFLQQKPLSFICNDNY